MDSPIYLGARALSYRLCTALCLFFLAVLCPFQTHGREAPGSPAPPQPIQGGSSRFYDNVYALVIGINTYSSPGIPRLQWAEKDAEDVATLFRDHYGYQVRMLTGSQATKAAILSSLDEYQKTLGRGDAFLMFFAGHGQSVPTGPYDLAGFLVPHDAQLTLANKQDADQWQNNAINMREIAERITAINARHVLVILDACYSGFIGRRATVAERVHLKQLLEQPSRIVITAGTEDQIALEDSKLRQGIFTYALLNELRKDIPLSAREVFIGLRTEVASRSNATMLPLLREIEVHNGEFVFIPKTVRNLAIAIQERVQHWLGIRGAQTTLEQYFEVSEVNTASDYRYAVNAPEQERKWKQQCQTFQNHASFVDPLAMAGLHYCFAKGLGMERNPAEAIRWAREAYYTGHPAGQHVLGRSYFSGIGVEQNAAAGTQLLTEAAKEGFAPAQLSLAFNLLRTADRRAEHVREAQGLLEKAAPSGLLYAQTLLGQLYSGRFPGISQDMSKALTLIQPAAERGFPEAQFNLFQVYIYRTGERGYAEKALPWLVRAAEAGHAFAQFTLAGVYYRREPVAQYALPNVSQDFGKARHWAQLAAAQQLPHAYYLLSFMSEHGHGDQINHDRAREYCEMAAKANYAPAITRQGIWYLNGTLYQRDDGKALQHFKQAAGMGDATAQFLVGRMFEEGWGMPSVPKSEVKLYYVHHALHWYVQAAKQGHGEAKQKLMDFDRAVQLRGPGFGPYPRDILAKFQREYPESAAEFDRIVRPR